MDIVPSGIFSEESITYNTKSVGTLDKELQQCIISVYVKGENCRLCKSHHPGSDYTITAFFLLFLQVVPKVIVLKHPLTNGMNNKK